MIIVPKYQHSQSSILQVDKDFTMKLNGPQLDKSFIRLPVCENTLDNRLQIIRLKSTSEQNR